jgi:hypothetical protein
MRKWQQCGAVLAMGLGLACSDEGGRSRDEAVGTQAASPAPSSSYGPSSVPAPGNGGGTTPAPATGGVAAPGGDGAPVGAPPLVDTGTLNGMPLGDALEFVAGTGLVPYAIGPNAYGITGGGFLARSTLGNTVTVGAEPGKICISGSLEEVPLNPDGHGNYGPYWGIEFGFNLNQGPAEGEAALTAPAPPSGAAGAGAGGAAATPMDVAQPWHPGKVVGFSFTIEGPTINLVRFKSLPDGFDSSLESSVFCKEIRATSGTPNSALFSELSTYCWSGISTLIPTAAGLDNISWQLPADVAPAGARPFDWCLSNLRPILAP